MQRFSALYAALEGTTSTNAKVTLMAQYFAAAPAADAAWAVYYLSGQRQKRLIGGARMRDWLAELRTDLPRWLIDECYTAVGDLAETVALLVEPDPARAASNLPAMGLADWVETQLLPLRDLDDAEQRDAVVGWWRALDRPSVYLVNKLLTGSLRVGVSKTLVVRALAQCAGLDRALLAHRLAGRWLPSADAYRRLLAADDGSALRSQPYPFFLASPLDQEPSALGAAQRFQAEWKWDGIRAQLIRRGGDCFIWSRGEEPIGERFPELVDAALEFLPDGCVVDGEILGWHHDDDRVLPFAELQKRIGRKTLGKKILRDVPAVLLGYDLLEHDGVDLRARPLCERGARLTTLLDGAPPALKRSRPLAAADWPALAALRDQARARRVEGLMLKALDSSYGVGRQKGAWWKWKVTPFTVDAVMIYAQAGHGRRANLFTDYTFAVWRGDELVPVAKAYSGLSNAEIEKLDRWVRRHTVERFGPVRSVTPQHVFELAFEGIARSTRHKSGVALRFPRIQRWRSDLTVRDADSLQQLEALLDA